MLFLFGKICIGKVFASEFENKTYFSYTIANNEYVVSKTENINDFSSLSLLIADLPDNSVIKFENDFVITECLNIVNKTLTFKGNITFESNLAMSFINSEIYFYNFSLTNTTGNAVIIDENSLLTIEYSDIKSFNNAITNKGKLVVYESFVEVINSNESAIDNTGSLVIAGDCNIKTNNICDIKTNNIIVAYYNSEIYLGNTLKIFYTAVIDFSVNTPIVNYVTEANKDCFVLSNEGCTLEQRIMNLYLIKGISPVITANFIDEHNNKTYSYYFINSGKVAAFEPEYNFPYKFLGWYNADIKFDFDFTITENINLYAKFTKYENLYNYTIGMVDDNYYVKARFCSAIDELVLYLNNLGKVSNEICYIENVLNTIDINRKDNDKLNNCILNFETEVFNLNFINGGYEITGNAKINNLTIESNACVNFKECDSLKINNFNNFGNVSFSDCFINNATLNNLGRLDLAYSNLFGSIINNSGAILNISNSFILSTMVCVENYGTLYIGGICSLVGEYVEIKTACPIYAYDINNVKYIGNKLTVDFIEKLDVAIYNSSLEFFESANSLVDLVLDGSDIKLEYYIIVSLSYENKIDDFRVKKYSTAKSLEIPILEKFTFTGFYVNDILIDENYVFENNTLVVAKYVENIITGIKIINNVYDYSGNELTFDVTGFNINDKILYFVNNEYTTQKPSFIDAGNYEIKIKIERENYFDLIIIDNFIINKVDYSFDNNNIKFDNNEVILLDVNLINPVIYYSLNENTGYSLVIPELKAGNNKIYIHIESANFNLVKTFINVYVDKDSGDFTMYIVFIVLAILVIGGGFVVLYNLKLKSKNKKIRIVDYKKDE
ncbi:MAG: hypothetical protein IJZ26_03175 [Clostridia bacterium]|nr:hypothetical protein [Clostridia bacterium]